MQSRSSAQLRLALLTLQQRFHFFLFFCLFYCKHRQSSADVEEAADKHGLQFGEVGERDQERRPHVPHVAHRLGNTQASRANGSGESLSRDETEQGKTNSIEKSADSDKHEVYCLRIAELHTHPKHSRQNHENYYPESALHLMAEKVGEETAEKLKTADDEHVHFKSVPVIVQRVLDCVVKAVVADLGETEDYERHQILSLSECIFDLKCFLLAILNYSLERCQLLLTVEPRNIVQTFQALLVSLLRVKVLRRLDDEQRHDKKKQ